MITEENSLLGGRYRLTKRVGKGAFGEVWLAQDEQTGIEVAVKIYIALDDSGIKDFKTEYSSTFQLNHQNLLHASYFDIDDDRPYLVMPYCPGSALNLIGKTDETEIWKFIRDTAAGLEYLHEQDIIHRDIKPDNILQDAKGHYLITDFGVSLRLKSTLRRNSTRGQNTDDISGTHAYMGPELFSPNPSAVKATDIWALGATLYEILTGELPFYGQSGAMMLSGAKVPQIPQPWSDNLRGLVSSCLDLETWNRPTAAALRKFADSVLEGQKPTWSSSRNHSHKSLAKTLLISATAVAVTLIAGFAIFFNNPTNPDPIPSQDTVAVTTYTQQQADSIAAAKVQATKDSIAAAQAAEKAAAEKAAAEQKRLAEEKAATEQRRLEEERTAAEKKRIAEEQAAAEKAAAEKKAAEEEAAAELKRKQSALSDEIITVNGVSFKMIAVQGGTFQMGATPEQGSDADSDERPVHSVTLSSFRIGETEVTQELWQAVMGSNPSNFTSNGLQCPVECVSWDDCQSFIYKLNRLTGKNFRLPTEAEWEFAARGGNKSRGYKYSGSDKLGSVACYSGNSGDRAHPVKTKSPNELGIYDMSGNVYEWCSDWYRDTYSSGSVTNPKGPSSGEYRVSRGGSYCSGAVSCRVSYRGRYSQSCRSSFLGLRLAF